MECQKVLPLYIHRLPLGNGHSENYGQGRQCGQRGHWLSNLECLLSDRRWRLCMLASTHEELGSEIPRSAPISDYVSGLTRRVRWFISGRQLCAPHRERLFSCPLNRQRYTCCVARPLQENPLWLLHLLAWTGLS